LPPFSRSRPRRSGRGGGRAPSTRQPGLRPKKSEEQRPLKTLVTLAVVRAPDASLALLPDVEADLRAAGLIRQLETATAGTLHVDVELEAPAPAGQEHAS
jgi:hypothetical protein